MAAAQTAKCADVRIVRFCAAHPQASTAIGIAARKPTSIVTGMRLLLPLLAVCVAVAADPVERAVNGGVEDGTAGWDRLWTREPGGGTAAIARDGAHGGGACWVVEHRGARDWSLAQSARVPVRAGDLLRLSAWTRFAGEGDAHLGVVARDPSGTVVDWNFAGVPVPASAAWTEVRTVIVVPEGVASVQPRLIGGGPCRASLDDLSLVDRGGVAALRAPGTPDRLSAQGAALRADLDTRDGSIALSDRRSGRTWIQAAAAGAVVASARQDGMDGIALELVVPADDLRLAVTLRADPLAPELVLTLRGDGAMRAPLRWPGALLTAAGQDLVLPVNEGVAFPVDDPVPPAGRFHLHGGHGLCMPWYGAMDAAGAGWMAIVDTPDDAEVDLPRLGGLLRAAPVWLPSRQAFAGERSLRYVLLDGGGHVAMAKRYRRHAAGSGLLRTLADKRIAVPAVDLLVGAVNTWCWDDGAAAAICREMREAGIQRILWSDALPPAAIRELNAMDVLTSRYDIYQDTMDPAQYPRLRYTHPDWTTAAWARGDIQLERDGRPVRGWEIEAKEGPMVPCGVLCDRQAPPYARERIAAELADHPYRCRFIDTTTASPWRECWDPRHPMTRSDSRRSRVDLLRVVSGEFGLVCGSETGHDAAVPAVHYFEGMLSLGPWRVPDSGRAMMRRWDEVPADVATFQTGHRYRLPLWELVYHDCVVAHWYWGDYSDKLPALWDRRDLWNALYGTMPMFMFDRARWNADRARYARSYAATAAVARATGYSEMTAHAWLTADRAVQRSAFANGVTVTVNFGERPWSDAAGAIPPLGRRVEGLRP